MKLYCRHILLPLFVGLIIFVGTCLLGSDDIPDMPNDIPWDKLAHFGMFFLLSAVCLWDYFRLYNGKPSKRKWIFWGFLIPVLYGGAIELLQHYVFTQRSGEWGDFAADVIGSMTATVLAIILIRKKEYPKKNISL
ncbi:MAG TPA: hypothetical protein DDZ96_05180 [Porphyromonadaceae bacterium]|jgi:VanZ family protein|uniref:VanZ family protein n=1 Tax=Limibacterium fermenti TaxID=3229863 RepID=UPI000E92BB71|nr:hypothetical protein [Porphyromonadaceae bacterium]HBK31122.1 hypothetical protein [Porphyromonadaceae bacterium]HBL33197.1 hypothetical protein [Porphyromonadaceae bacterium]HBX20090.1 hypothetical protein [Porphyromonadaceae bacterium]HBX45614.1 hypothetical protein [Porphyromonadaceae bacterium]